MRRYTQEYERDHRSRPYRGHMGTGLLLHTLRGPRRDQTGGKFRSGCGSAHGGSAVSPRPTEYGLKLGFKGRFPPSRTSCPQLGHAGCRPMAKQNRLLLCSATTRVQTLLRRMGPVMAHFTIRCTAAIMSGYGACNVAVVHLGCVHPQAEVHFINMAPRKQTHKAVASGQIQERGKRCRTRKPFITIQRVRHPPGKGEPASRKRVLHGQWQHPP